MPQSQQGQYLPPSPVPMTPYGQIEYQPRHPHNQYLQPSHSPRAPIILSYHPAMSPYSISEKSLQDTSYQSGRVACQPGPTRGMSLSMKKDHRNSRGIQRDANSKRSWTFGLLDCFGDGPTCFFSCFCPCIIYGQNKTRIRSLATYGSPEPHQGDNMCNGDCWCFGCLTAFFGLGWVLQTKARGSTRSRYGIRGSSCGDCCTAFWCLPCALVQESREVELEELSLQSKLPL